MGEESRIPCLSLYCLCWISLWTFLVWIPRRNLAIILSHKKQASFQTGKTIRMCCEYILCTDHFGLVQAKIPIILPSVLFLPKSPIVKGIGVGLAVGIL